MLELKSSLNTKLQAGRLGAQGDTGITLGERPVRDLWQIAGWQEFETAAIKVLSDLGLGGLGSYSLASMAKGRTTWRIAPDKILIENTGNLSDYMSADLATLDLSHARTVISLSGRKSRDVLSQLIAVDVSDDAFPEGRFLQSGIHHVGELIQCVGDNAFEIYVPVSWAETVWEAICENAMPYGIEIIAE
ncbi:sarcosine oxidase subunit gamma [uncultured Ruegeria sp.]|uniref:sarcosine oxidase subunit gamma n=1 Tax=uncultured Ruegeria sp. TaxID=259304 RepID=UPI00261142F9|nr:sarcosine oxidase subunit gamma family protein [uncultured Ruegeria sp.]